MAAVPANTKHNFDDKNFLKFETLTMVPICKKLINKNLLSQIQIQWLNSYHQNIFENLSPFMVGKDFKYLKKVTSPL